MTDPVCVIIGVGPGNGQAFAAKFAEAGYRVALLSRSTDTLDAMAAEMPKCQAFHCDAADPASVRGALDAAAAAFGPADVLLYNAGGGVFGTIDDVDLEMMDYSWRVNVQGLAAAAQHLAPGMIERGRGTILVTGATASLRGGARFAAFAQAKAAQRSLAQSMAKHWGPKGLHVALLIVDGVIDLSRTRRMLPDRADDGFLAPADIAETVYFICHQPRSAWTFEVDVRPYAEQW